MNFREWTIKQWVISAVLGLVLLSVGVRVHLKWRIHRAVEALTASGAMTRFEDFYKVVPPIPDDDNMVVLLTNAAGLFVRPDKFGNSKIPYVVGGNRSGVVTGQPWPEDTWVQTKEYLAENPGGYGRVTEALARKQARYFWNYNPYSVWDIRPLSNAKNVANHLRLAADFALETGETDQAAIRVIELYKLTESLLVEPLAINVLVASALSFVAQPPLERLLGFDSMSEANVAELRDVIRSSLRKSNISLALEGGRVVVAEGVRRNLGPLYSLRGAPGFVPDDYHEQWNRGREMISRMIGVVDADLLLYLDTMELIIAKSKTINGQIELQNEWTNYVATVQKSGSRYITELEMETLPRLLTKRLQIHTRLTCADLALAVEQYRRMNGSKLPDALEDLVPDFIETVPDEPYSGKPYELILTPDGYGIGREITEFRVSMVDRE